MSINLQKSNQLKSIAILMMLCLHLFNRDYRGLFEPLLFVGTQPLSYYISLFCDACVPIFAFVSGYGLYFKYQQNPAVYSKQNLARLRKLYVNFWIILLLFAVLLETVMQVPGYPGSLTKFVLNFTAIDPSYNGAWWFLTIYILFVLTSSFWFRLLNRMNPYLFFTILLPVYIAAFYVRTYVPADFDNDLINWLQSQTALYFCTLFQFMMGAFALRYQWHLKVTGIFSMLPYKNAIALLMMALFVIFHGIVPNLIVAPFTGLGYIFLFLQLDLPVAANKALDFFMSHATNMWLVHMFFYMIFFSEFVYSFRFILPIFAVLIILSVLSSYLINLINRPLQKWL